MLTILFYITVKPGVEESFQAMAARLTRMTRAEDEGCITYRFHRRSDAAREYLLYEQWQDPAALQAHLQHLIQELGPAPEGEHLPAAFLDLCESTQAIGYDVIEQ